MLKLDGNSLTAQIKNQLASVQLTENRLPPLSGFVKPGEIDEFSNRVSQRDLTWLLTAHPETIPFQAILKAIQELPHEEESKERQEPQAATYRQAA